MKKEITIPTIKKANTDVIFYQGNLPVSALKTLTDSSQKSHLSENIITVPSEANAVSSEVHLEYNDTDFYSVHLLTLDLSKCFKSLSVELDSLNENDHLPVVFIRNIA